MEGDLKVKVGDKAASKGYPQYDMVCTTKGFDFQLGGQVWKKIL